MKRRPTATEEEALFVLLLSVAAVLASLAG